MRGRRPALTALVGALVAVVLGPITASSAPLVRGGSPSNLVALYFNESAMGERCLDFRVDGVCVRPSATGVDIGIHWSYWEPVAWVETGTTEGFESFLPFAGEVVAAVNGLGIDDVFADLIVGDVLGLEAPDLPLDGGVASGSTASASEKRFTEARAFQIPYVYTWIQEQILGGQLVCGDPGNLCSVGLPYASELDLCWHTGACDVLDLVASTPSSLAAGDWEAAGSGLLDLVTAAPGVCLVDVVDRLLEDGGGLADLETGIASLGEDFADLVGATDGFGLEALGQTWGGCEGCAEPVPGIDALVNRFEETVATFGEHATSFDDPITDLQGTDQGRIERSCLGTWGALRPRHGRASQASDLVAQARAGYVAASLGFQPGLLNYARAVQELSGGSVPIDPAGIGEVLAQVPAAGGSSGGCSVAPGQLLRFDPHTEIYTRMKIQEGFPAGGEPCFEVGDLPVSWQIADKAAPFGDATGLIERLGSADSVEDLGVLGGQAGFSLWNHQGCCYYALSSGMPSIPGLAVGRSDPSP